MVGWVNVIGDVYCRRVRENSGVGKARGTETYVVVGAGSLSSRAESVSRPFCINTRARSQSGG